MNKWFASARDLSDSESEDSSDEEKKVTTQQPTAAQAAGKKTVQPKKQYMKGFDESSESEEDIRTIKTQKDKKLETINAIIKDINNHIKINDFSSLMTDFERYTEELQKDFDNNAGIIYNKNDKEGVLPIQYLRILVKIEDAMNDVTQATKDKKVTLNKTNSVSLNKLKQKMKKYLPITGPTDNHLELQIAQFRENPVWSEDERKAVKAAEKKKQEETKAAAATTKPAAKKKAESDEEESEEEESEYDEEEESEVSESSESSADEIDIFKIPREQMTPAQRRLKWVKKDRLPLHLQQQLNQKTQAKIKETKESKETAQKQTDQLNAAIAAEGKVKGEVEVKETVLNLKTDYQQIDFTKMDNVTKKIKELQDERMKGKFDPRYHSSVYIYMLQQVKDSRVKVEISINLINSLFDTAKYTSQGHLNRDTWLITYENIQSLLALLATPQIKESLSSYLQREQNEKDSEDDESDDEPASTTVEIEKSILPALANFLEKLDHELLKAYQNITPTKIEYLQRLRDDNKFVYLCDSVIQFLKENRDLSKVARIATLKLDHIYFKNDVLYAKIKASNVQGDDENKPYILNEDSQQVVSDLVSLVNAHGTQKMKLRAALYMVYHHSIHNRFHQAKDLLLKTHIADIIHLQDIGSQIIYNRAITQVGMSAFRLGLIEEAHDILVDICQTVKLREVLAQGFSRTPDKPIELEKEEMKRQVPFHMHINLQQLDCIYLTTAMLLEIPNIAENQFSVNKKIISKNFKKLIDTYDSKAFLLAAENYRDNLVFAAKKLNKSHWKEAVDHIFSIKLIQKIPEFQAADGKFKESLVNKFKEAALKAFLCRGGRTYQSFSLESLEKQFELPQRKLHQIISKMIIKSKISAHFDQGNKLLILDNQSNDIKELQQLSAQYVDKLELMVENNERLVDMIAGGNLYQHKERTAFEISAINASKRQKQFMKATGGSGIPNVGQASTTMISNPGQRLMQQQQQQQRS